MAKIVFVHPASDNIPEYTETVEARIWGMAGSKEQCFYIGGGFNSEANGNFWLEIIYHVDGAQNFYTRNFLHSDPLVGRDQTWRERLLDELVSKGEGSVGFGSSLPSTSLEYTLEKITYQISGKEHQAALSKLEISADIGSVFGRSGPESRFIKILLDDIEIEKGVSFMRDLIQEMTEAMQGKHPDPARFIDADSPGGLSEWSFVEQLNRKAYNKISENYQENYFDNPLLSETFDGWLAQLPAGGHILDAGCGHGHPVITRLLEKGFQVTGSDLSPEMLRRASQRFPQENFSQVATPMIADQARFDGICSFHSMLYLDPIDFLFSIYRLHEALKPDGLIFLYAYDSGPDWRGQPLHHMNGQWMWAWHYGMEEAAGLLEEHSYFKVIDKRKVKIDEGEAERIAQALEKQKQEEENRRRQECDRSRFPLPYLGTPGKRSPYTYMIIARRLEK